MSQAWLKEWHKFTPQAIEEIKSHNDDTHLEREWMSYVYEKNGRYYIGKPSLGEDSAISVVPAEKGVTDFAAKGPKEMDDTRPPSQRRADLQWPTVFLIGGFDR